MFIAFEGPDKVGKSTTANTLDMSRKAGYNLTKETYEQDLAAWKENGSQDTVICYDRIDWMTHLVYRLALPGYEWNDPRVRTVFASPDLHLVFKIHRKENLKALRDELYDKDWQLPQINEFYRQWAYHLVTLNESFEFSLFKSITILEVDRVGDEHLWGGPVPEYYAVKLSLFSSRKIFHGPSRVTWNEKEDDYQLLQMLREAE